MSGGAAVNQCPRPDVLVAWREGVLPDDVESAVAAHLAECAMCRQLREDLRGVPFAEPGVGAMEQLRVRARGAHAGGALGRRRWRWMMTGGGGAIAAALVVWAVLGTDGGGSPVAKTAQAPAAVAFVAAYRLPLAVAPLRLPLRVALPFRGGDAAESSAAPRGYLEALGKAMEPYRAGEYAAAVAQFAELGRQYPRAVEPHFYEGVSRLLAGGVGADAKAAATALARAEAIGGEALNDEISWYRAVAEERAGRWDAAAPFLKKLCGGGEGVHKAAACGALERR